MVAYLLVQDLKGYDDCDKPIGIFLYKDEAEKHIAIIEAEDALIKAGYSEDGQSNMDYPTGINKYSGLYVDQHYTNNYSVEWLPMLRVGSDVLVIEKEHDGTQG